MNDSIIMNNEIANTASAGTDAGSQIYIGTPAGIVMCVDGLSGVEDDALYDFDVCLWNKYSRGPMRVSSPEQMLSGMENLFDLINYPRPTTTLRSFSEKNAGSSHGDRGSYDNAKSDNAKNDNAKSDNSENGLGPQGQPQNARNLPGNPANVPRFLTDEDLLEKRGKIATFIIRVQQRQYSDWQGRITWVEKNRTLRFRTTTEMLKLIEAALASV